MIQIILGGAIAMNEQIKLLERLISENNQINRLIEDYNKMVEKYNSLANQLKTYISQYNTQANAFNECIASAHDQ